MRFGQLKAIGHNIADSFASGLGFPIGVFAMDVYGEASAPPEGFIVVDFVNGTTSGGAVSPGLARATAFYREAFVELCGWHGVAPECFVSLTARFGTDAAYGRHFTVELEDHLHRRSREQYVGVPGRRVRRFRTARREV